VEKIFFFLSTRCCEADLFEENDNFIFRVLMMYVSFFPNDFDRKHSAFNY
jgi:hypothetical protein